MYIVDHAKKRKSREWFIVYNIVWNMPSECYCCRVSEVSIDLSFEWIDPFGKNWNFILYCYETKEKNPWKLEHERKMEKVFLNQDRRVILLWINPNFCHGKECEGFFSGRILLAVGFVFFRRNSLDEKWCHERRLWAQRSPAILLGWWSVNGPCSCPPFVTWEFHYNLKRNRKEFSLVWKIKDGTQSTVDLLLGLGKSREASLSLGHHKKKYIGSGKRKLSRGSFFFFFCSRPLYS